MICCDQLIEIMGNVIHEFLFNHTPKNVFNALFPQDREEYKKRVDLSEDESGNYR